jgi:hypothetical protein
MFTIDNIKEYFNKLPTDYVGYDDEYKFIIKNISNNTPFAFSRFNDGEIMGIERPNSIVSRGAQVVDNSLHELLKKSITHKQKNYYIGIPCSKCYPKYYNIANDLIGEYEYKVRAVCNINRNYAKFISELKKVLKNKQIIWIGGDDQNIKNITDVLDIKIKQGFLFSSKNVWDERELIKKSLNVVGEGDIVMFSLGPTGRILSQEMFYEKQNSTFIDVGSLLDPITRNVWHSYYLGWEKGFNKTKKCKICN